MTKEQQEPKRNDFFVSLTDENGREVWVNVGLVRLVKSATEGKSTLLFAVNHSVTVKGQPHAVVRTLYLGDAG